MTPLSPTGQDLLRKAEKASDGNRLLEATRWYKQLVQERPDWADGHRRLGRIYAQRGRHREATDALKTAVELGAETAEIHHELAQSYRKFEDPPFSALSHAERATKLEPLRAESFDLAGELSWDCGQAQRALGFFNHAIRRSPDYTPAYLHLAQHLEALGRASEAHEVLMEAACRDPTSLRFEEDWTALERLSQDPDRYAVLVSRKPELEQNLADNSRVWIDWGRTLLAISWARLLGHEALLQALELACKQLRDGQIFSNPRCLVTMSLEALLGSVSDPSGLQQLNKQVLQTMERYDVVYVCDEWARLVDDEGVRKEVYAAVDRVDDERVDLVWARFLLYEENKPAEAMKYLERVLQRNDQSSYALGQLAIVYASQNDVGMAYSTLIGALKLYQKQEEVVAGLPLAGFKGFTSEPRHETIQEVDDLVKRLNQASLSIEWAKVLIQLGECSRALEHLKAALEQEQSIDYRLLGSALAKPGGGRGIDEALVADWAAWLRKADHRGEFLHLAYAVGDHDRQMALSYVQEAVKGVAQEDPLWLEAGRAFKKFDAPGKALDGFARLLPEDNGTVNSSFYRDWVETFVDADRNDPDTGHLSNLVRLLESWKEDDQFKGKMPEIDWDQLKERRAAQRSGMQKLVESVRRNVDNFDVCRDVGRTLYNNREYEAALEVLRHAEALNTTDESVAQLLGWSLVQLNRLPEAKLELDRAIELLERQSKPPWWWPHFGMAMVIVGLDGVEKAGPSYQRALDLAPSPEWRSSVCEDWSRTLTLAGELEEALAKADRSRGEAAQSETQDDDVWSAFRTGHVYETMCCYEKAITYYEKAISISEHPYPQNNIAFVKQKKLGYSKVAREEWRKACNLYHRRMVEAIRSRDAQFFLYYGSAHEKTFGNRAVAMILYRIGLELQENDAGLLTNLGRLYMEESRRPSKERASQVVGECPNLEWSATACWNKAEVTLQEREKRFADPETLIELGALYLEMGDEDRAEKAYRRAAGTQSMDSRVQRGLGEVYSRTGRAELAVRQLEQALKIECGDLDLRTMLGRAYLANGQRESAESAFRSVLGKNSEHFEAQAGRGEVYIAMAEELRKKKDAEARLFWKLAVTHLVRAIEIADSAEGRGLITPRKRASIHYLLGYARVNRYEYPSSLRRPFLLRKALSDFETCRNLDPTHHQAERACERIREQLLPISSPNLLTNFLGPFLIGGLALCLLFVALWAKLYGWEHSGSPAAYRLTEEFRSADSIPEELRTKLESAIGKTFSDEKALLDYLASLAGARSIHPYKGQLVRHAFVPAGGSEQWYLPDDSWVLISLGAILFLIAGVCLPFLTSLRVGPLQLEKSVGEQVEMRAPLGITMERLRSSSLRN